jgi:hypothetical protein
MTRREACLLFVGLLIPGCRGRDPAEEARRYQPDPVEARGTLTAALSEWRDGQPQPKTERAALYFVDHQKHEGRKLKAFELLGDAMSGNLRHFDVRLTLSDPDEKPVVKYAVFGRTPRFVYRLEDFEMIMHWEHHMTEEETAANEAERPVASSRADQPPHHAPPDPKKPENPEAKP